MIRKLSMLLLAILVCILFIKNLWNIDIAGTKNNGLMREHLMRIEAMRSIDSIKLEAKTVVQQIRDTQIKQSKISSAFLLLLAGIIVTAIIIYSTPVIKN